MEGKLFNEVRLSDAVDFIYSFVHGDNDSKWLRAEKSAEIEEWLTIGDCEGMTLRELAEEWLEHEQDN